MSKKKKKSSKAQNNQYQKPTDASHTFATQSARENFVTTAFVEAKRTLRKAIPGKVGIAMEDFSLNEPCYSRRIEAVARYMPKIAERYAQKYPQMNIESDFAAMCSCPALGYNTIDSEVNICLGATIWLLDTLNDTNLLVKALPFLPQVEWNDVDIPPIYDPCHDESMINSMLYVVQNRYGVNSSSYVFAGKPQKDQHDTSNNFHAILDLIPDEIKERAVDNFRTKAWQLADLYYELVSETLEKYERAMRKFDRLLGELNALNVKLEREQADAKNAARLSKFPLANAAPIWATGLALCRCSAGKQKHQPRQGF